MSYIKNDEHTHNRLRQFAVDYRKSHSLQRKIMQLFLYFAVWTEPNPTQPNPTHRIPQKIKPNPNQPNPWVDPTHGHLCLSLYHNCDSTTIRLRRKTDMFVFCLLRIGSRRVRYVVVGSKSCRSRIAIVITAYMNRARLTWTSINYYWSD